MPLDNIAKRAAAYIAEVKRELGLPMYDAPNAVEELKYPTAEKLEAIKDMLKYYERYKFEDIGEYEDK